MIRAWKTSEGVTITREVKKQVGGSKDVFFTVPIPTHEMESFFEAIYPFYQEFISMNVTVLSKDMRPIGILDVPGKKPFFYITMDTYIMLCDDRAKRPDKSATRALTRLVSFNGDESDLRVALSVARQRNMQGIAQMINWFLEQEMKEKEVNP